MGAALVAYIDRHTRSIELDPAVRPGARLDGDGEARLLHTTSAGHCEETAAYLAEQLRRSGWKVRVRAFERLAPIAQAPRTTGMLLDGVALHLTATIGHANPGQSPAKPRVRAVSATARKQMRQHRQQCQICGHLTRGQGVRSHRENRHHDDWKSVIVEPDGTVTPAQAQAGTPEASGGPSSASE